MKNVVALILCKGNSKGVKNKNMKMFSGKPTFDILIDDKALGFKSNFILSLKSYLK